MQTFLPYSQFARSAAALDNRRLGKQLVEVQQIYTAVHNPDYGWQHHPAVNMWRGYTDALLLYGLLHYREWQQRLTTGQRGGKMLHKSGEFIKSHWVDNGCKIDVILPCWLGDDDIHASHRARLLHKAPGHYGKFGWKEAPTLAVWWPVLPEVKSCQL